MIIYTSLLVSVIGFILYLVVTKPEIKEAGRLAFAVSLLAFLLTFASNTAAFVRDFH